MFFASRQPIKQPHRCSMRRGHFLRSLCGFDCRVLICSLAGQDDDRNDKQHFHQDQARSVAMPELVAPSQQDAARRAGQLCEAERYAV